MPDYFAHASAGEWGSISVDLGLSLATGGGGAARTVVQMGSRLSRRLVGRVSRALNRLPGRSRVFYTVQDAKDIARLRAGGEPWPTEPMRTLLGEGVYTWATKRQARSYLKSKIESGVSDAQVLKIQILKKDYSNLKTLDLRKMSDEARGTWLDEFSLYGKGNGHGYDHIVRETWNFGPEFYFSKSVFHLFF